MFDALGPGCADGPGGCRRRRRSQDSSILGEQFYFFTVVLMWLIHAGFMSYEAGVARRKNVMSTAMKNILTIAVVTPTFYYFGWMIYGCAQPGTADHPELRRLHRRRSAPLGIPWSNNFAPEPQRTTST